MSTEQQTPTYADPAQPADATLTSPVPPATESTDQAATETPTETPTASADHHLASGSLALFTTVNQDGFESEAPCLVLDTFEHDGADGDHHEFVHVILLPPIATVRREQLAAYGD